MLQEVLFALSGHPSPLFNSHLEAFELSAGTKYVNQDFPDLSPSEAALLESVGRLAILHRALRAVLQRTNSRHSSTICRAVAASMLNTHLARFQKKILDVERQILLQSASLVGAYSIVPLSGIVGEFEEWIRPMQWYWDLAAFIDPSGLTRDSGARLPTSKAAADTSGAALIDHLRQDSHTGYPDIQRAAVELSKVAETAWMKQLSTWILYGQLPKLGADDFLIQVDSVQGEGGPDTFSINHSLMPSLVFTHAASSILFIGKSLYQLKQYRGVDHKLAMADAIDDNALATTHLRMLSTMSLPLVPAAFSRSIAAVRLSLSRNVLQRLLPMDEIVKTLNLLRDFFLFRRGDFALTLIEKAEECLLKRQAGLGSLLQSGSSRDLRNMVIKEGEVSEALAQTWKALATAQMYDEEDQTVEHARDCIRLEISRSSTDSNIESQKTSNGREVASRPILFNNLLFPTSTNMVMRPQPPLDLFISTNDIAQYSAISAYLLAIRRSHLRLSNLWRLSTARRDMRREQKASPSGRQREMRRSSSMRKVWATCSSTLFLLSETSAYFEGEILKSSWDHFYAWATHSKLGSTRPTSKQSHAPDMSSLEASMHETSISSPRAATAQYAQPADPTTTHQHDPETLSQAHRHFLASLSHSILLTDKPFTTELRTLTTHIDNLIAHFEHLHQIQQSLDLDLDLNLSDTAKSNNGKGLPSSSTEEQETSLELDRARKRTDSAVRSLVARLRQLDHERVGADRYLRFDNADAGTSTGTGTSLCGNNDNDDRNQSRARFGNTDFSHGGDAGFVPFRGGGLERLLMKLEFGSMTDVEVLDFYGGGL